MQKYFKISFFVLLLVCSSMFLYESDCLTKTSREPIIIKKKIVDQKNIIKGFKTDPDSRFDSKTGLFKPRFDIPALKTEVAPFYDPKGKIDPFEPLFKETPKIGSKSSTYADTGRKPTTVLEKIDLSQLRLTGIILAASGNKALVQEASGRGHIISEGTYIGIHGGRVSAVQRNKVIIDEKMKDVSGRLFLQKTELKIRSTPTV